MFPHCSSLSRGPPWGAEPGFELGLAVQQADALLSEPRRTLKSAIGHFSPVLPDDGSNMNTMFQVVDLALSCLMMNPI